MPESTPRAQLIQQPQASNKKGLLLLQLGAWMSESLGLKPLTWTVCKDRQNFSAVYNKLYSRHKKVQRTQTSYVEIVMTTHTRITSLGSKHLWVALSCPLVPMGGDWVIASGVGEGSSQHSHSRPLPFFTTYQHYLSMT